MTQVSTFSNRFSLAQRGVGSGGSGVVVAVNTNFEGEFGTLWAQTVDGITNSGPVQTNTPTVDTSYVEWVFDQAFICDALLAAGGDNNTYGVWKIHGSNDGVTYDYLADLTWTNTASGSPAAVFANQNVITNGCLMTFTNTVAYNRYKIVYHSSFGAAGRYCYEMLFRCNQNQFNGGVRTSLITGTTNITESHGITGLSKFFDNSFRPYNGSEGENLYTTIVNGSYFRFQFTGESVVMRDVIIMLGMNTDVTNFGTWKWQRSPDGSTWTDEGPPFLFNFDGINHDTNMVLPSPGGSTPAEYWQLICTDASTKNHNLFMYEWLFNLDDKPPKVNASAGYLLATSPKRITPTKPNSVIVANIVLRGSTARTVSSITSTSSLTWTKLYGNTFAGNSTGGSQEVWYAILPTPGNEDLTITLSGAVDQMAVALTAVNDVFDISAPFDSNGSLPAHATGGSGTLPQVAFSTDADFTLVLGLYARDSDNILTNDTSTGWADAGNISGGSGFDKATAWNQSKVFTSSQSGTTTQMSSTATGWEMVAIALAGSSGITPVDGTASGVTVTATASIHYGDITAPGDTVTATASVHPGEAGEAVAVDGTRILEFAASISDVSVYSNADYNSVYSLGDRSANGLIKSDTFNYPGHVFAEPSQSYDGNYSFPSGSGFVYDGGTFATWSHWIDFGKFGVDIRAFRFVGTDVVALTDFFAFVGGIAPGVYLAESYAQEFDEFLPRQDDSPRDDRGKRFYEYITTPRYPIPWPHYEFVYLNSGSSAGGRFSNETEFKIAHSSLDGGDRRPGHATPQKTVTASLSSGWTSEVGSAYDTFALSPFDGVNYKGNDGSGYASSVWRGGDGGGFTPMSTAGQYMQFVFPRKVYMNYVLFQIDIGFAEVYSGGNPTKYGKWHWEISTNGGTTWFQVGDTWWFRDDCSYMAAPQIGYNPNDAIGGGGPGHSIVDSNGTFNFPRNDSTGVPVAGCTHWRMVLESGPAFAQSVYQIMFDLQDPGDTSLPLTAAFTDDTDGLLPVLTMVAGNPRRVAFTDGDSDVLTGTLTIIPNLHLTANFSDGDSDVLEAYGSFYPSTVVQTIINSKG